MNELLEKWKKEFNLTEWTIYLVKAKKSELSRKMTIMKKIYDCPINADNMYNDKLKVAFIRYVDFSERSLVHELLHLLYPLESESKIESRTIQIIKSLKK